MIAIHKSNAPFHIRWKSYCESNGIPFKLVDCYSNDLIEQLHDCSVFMWHHSHSNAKDLLVAKQILFAVEQSGKRVFPDFNTNWHFDDKVGQKYLLESIRAPLANSYVFFDKGEALNWASHATFPKVWKLRVGAGSSHVKLVLSAAKAKRIINKAFGSGFSLYDGISNLKERWRKYSNGLTDMKDMIKGFIRLGHMPEFAKIVGKERGYVYFQDFIAGNDSDTRVIVIGDKAFAIKRYVRKGDFRASGSGHFGYLREEFDERCISIAFEVTQQLKAQCLAYDFVFEGNMPKIIEMSYGFSPSGYDNCPGYWDSQLRWHEGKFNPYGWMVDIVNC